MAEDCIISSYHTSRYQVFSKKFRLPFRFDSWDWGGIYGPKVVMGPDNLYYMYYTAYDDGTSPSPQRWRVCVLTSTDLIHWRKPIIHAHQFPPSSGDTANNIVVALAETVAGSNNMQFLDIVVDPFWNIFLMTVRNDTSGANVIYSSTNGRNFTLLSGFFNGTTGTANGGVLAHPDNHAEGKALSWHPVDQKWRYWYNDGHFVGGVGFGLRSIGYYDSASLSGPFVNRGHLPEFTSAANALQYYDFSPFYYKGSMWAAVNVYNSENLLLGPLRLYRSEDHGNTWTRSTDLLNRGVPGTWDSGLITDGCPILVDGVWHLFYGGKTGTHGSTDQISFGLATAVENPAMAVNHKGIGISGKAAGGKSNIIPDDSASRRTILDKQGELTLTRDEWDQEIYGPIVVKALDGTYRMYYNAYETNFNKWSPAVAFSTDLINWTKPILNRISYEGAAPFQETVNNLVIFRPDDPLPRYLLVDLIIAEGQYVALCQNQTNSSVTQIWKSDNGLDWTFVQTAFGGHYEENDWGYSEPKSIVYVDGVYRIYWGYHGSDVEIAELEQRRTLGYHEALTLESNWHDNRTGANDGPFIDRGIIGDFHSTSVEKQFYDIKHWHYGGSLWACVAMFAKTSDILGPLRLYRSDDGGISYEYIGNLIENGTGTDIDAGLIGVAKPLLVDGIWYMHYFCSNGLHGDNPRPMKFAYATGIENPAIADITKINGTPVIGDGSNVPWNAG